MKFGEQLTSLENHKFLRTLSESFILSNCSVIPYPEKLTSSNVAWGTSKTFQYDTLWIIIISNNNC